LNWLDYRKHMFQLSQVEAKIRNFKLNRDQRTKKQGNKGTAKSCETIYTSGHLIPYLVYYKHDRIRSTSTSAGIGGLPCFTTFYLFPCFFVLWSLIEFKIPNVCFYLFVYTNKLWLPNPHVVTTLQERMAPRIPVSECTPNNQLHTEK